MGGGLYTALSGAGAVMGEVTCVRLPSVMLGSSWAGPTHLHCAAVYTAAPASAVASAGAVLLPSVALLTLLLPALLTPG